MNYLSAIVMPFDWLELDWLPNTSPNHPSDARVGGIDLRHESERNSTANSPPERDRWLKNLAAEFPP